MMVLMNHTRPRLSLALQLLPSIDDNAPVINATNDDNDELPSMDTDAMTQTQHHTAPQHNDTIPPNHIGPLVPQPPLHTLHTCPHHRSHDRRTVARRASRWCPARHYPPRPPTGMADAARRCPARDRSHQPPPDGTLLPRTGPGRRWEAHAPDTANHPGTAHSATSCRRRGPP